MKRRIPLVGRMIWCGVAVLAFLLIPSLEVSAEVSSVNIRSGATNPAKCSVGVGLGQLKLFYNTTSHTFKFCSATDTWSDLGGAVLSGDNTWTGTQTFGAGTGKPSAVFTPLGVDPGGLTAGTFWCTSHAHATPDACFAYLNSLARQFIYSNGPTLLGTDTIFPVSKAGAGGLGISAMAAINTGLSCSATSGVWTCNNTGALLTANTFTAAQTFQGATPIVLDGATAGTNATTVTVTDPTGARTFTIPDANSVAVQPATCAAGQRVTAVSAAGVVTCTDALLNKQDAAAEIDGDGTDKTLYTFSVPAGTIASGGCIKARVWVQHTTGTASTAFKWYFGATATSGTATTSTGVINSGISLCNNAGVTNAQTLAQTTTSAGSTAYAALIATPAEDTTAAIVLKYTFAVASGDKVTPKLWVVER